jgi:predicted nucleic acid-binding protein
MANTLVVARRRARLPAERIAPVLQNLAELPIEVDRPPPKSVLDLCGLAMKYDLAVYDAAYLELAIRLGLPMATRDAALRRGMLSAGVPFVEP